MVKESRFRRGAFLAIILVFAQCGTDILGDWQLYSTVSTGGGSLSPNTFVTVNPQTGEMTIQGAQGGTPEQDDIDMDPISGFLFGTNVYTNPSVVTRIDPETGQWTDVATIRQGADPVYLTALSFSPNGTLYGISGSRTLGVINIGLNTFSPIVELDISGDVYGMDFSPQGVLYLSDWSSTEHQQWLRTIDILTGEVSFTQPIIGDAFVGDIDFAPDGYIYHTNFSWYLFKIDPATAEQIDPDYFGGLGPFGGIASNYVPEPATFLLLCLGVPIVSRLRKK